MGSSYRLRVADRAVFVAIGPRLNRRVSTAFRLHAAELLDLSSADDDNRVGFTPITLEAVIEALAEARAVDLARQLWLRYLDFPRVYERALAADVPNASFKRLAAHSSLASKRTSPERPPGTSSESPTDQSSSATSAPGAEDR